MHGHDQRGRRIERRRALRKPLERDAYFGAGDISVLPQNGQTIDVSRDGVLIRTPKPLPEGSPVEVELRPGKWVPGRELILSHGRVARIRDCGDGDYDMGVRLQVTPIQQKAPYACSKGTRHTLPDVGSLMANLRPRDAAYAYAHRYGWGGHSRRAHPKEAQSKSSWWKAWRWPLLTLALGLLSLFLWPALLRDVGPDGNLQRYEANPAVSIDHDDRIPEQTVPAQTTSPDRQTQFDDLDSVEPFRETNPSVTEIEFPEPDRTMIRDAAFLASAPVRWNGGAPFYQRQSEPTPNAQCIQSLGVLLEVDRANHRMRLFKNSALQQSFSIGLGRRWLGLSRDVALTPYGIRAT